MATARCTARGIGESDRDDTGRGIVDVKIFLHAKSKRSKESRAALERAELERAELEREQAVADRSDHAEAVVDGDHGSVGPSALENLPGEVRGQVGVTNDMMPSRVGEASGEASAQSSVMFWVLVLAAAVVFLPCVLVPVWQDYEIMRRAEQQQALALRVAQARVAGLERHLDALLNDPAVIARLAQRDLAMVRPEHDTVLVGDSVSSGGRRMSMDGVDGDFSEDDALTGLPAIVGRCIAGLPLSDRHDLFLDAHTRRILLGLSTGLLVTAFYLFPVRRQRTG